MALMTIVKYPDPVLKTKCTPVTEFDDKLKTLVADMAETMEAARGIGLAAIQVAVPKRLLVIDIGELSSDEEYIEGDEESERRLSEKKKTCVLETFINPEIIESSGDIDYEEGCLSVPGVYATVKRKDILKLKYQDVEGVEHIIETEGLKSIVLQHEMDHLDGILFPDRLSPLKKMVLLKQYKKLQEEKVKV